MIDYLTNGNIKNSVNYPKADMGICQTKGRVTIHHKNVTNMITRFTGLFSEAGINISDMVNSSKGEYAYTMIDVDSDIPKDFADKLAAIDGVIRVRLIK